MSGFLFLLTVVQDVELSATSSPPCLPVCHRAAHRDENGLNLWYYKQASVKCSLFLGLLWSQGFARRKNRTLTVTASLLAHCRCHCLCIASWQRLSNQIHNYDSVIYRTFQNRASPKDYLHRLSSGQMMLKETMTDQPSHHLLNILLLPPPKKWTQQLFSHMGTQVRAKWCSL